MQNQIDLLRSDGKEAVSMPFTFLNPFKSLNL